MDVKPLPAIVILVLFLAIGGSAAYLSNRAISIQGPSDLSKDQNGALYVRIHQKVFVYDVEGEYKYNFDFGPLGISEIWGGLAFFRNGDLLLSPSLLSDGGATESGIILDRLNRCVLSTGQCQLLHSHETSFRRTFRTFIDSRDQIFLSDSARGKVSWLNSDGSVIDTLSKLLDHPNKILRDGNQIVVADTDANSLLIIPLEGSLFSAEDQWTRISTEPPKENSWRVSQPVDFSRVEEGWVVLVKDKKMSRSVLRHYDETGSFTGETKLQRRGFIIALETLAGNLIATDYRNRRVLRFRSDGSALRDLTSPEQEDYLAELEGQIDFYNTASALSWTLFGVLLVGGMVFGVRRELQRVNALKPVQPRENTAPQHDTEQPTWGDTRVDWLGKPRFDIFAVILGLMVVMLISLGFVEVGNGASVKCTGMNVILMMTGVISLAVIVPLAVLRKRLKNTNIGVRDEWVVVRFPDGNTEMARDRDLLQVNHGFIVNQRKVSIGNHRQFLYSKKDIETLLEPRLARAKSLTPGEHMRWEWQHNKRTTLIGGSISVIMLVAVLLLEFGYGEAWLKDKIHSGVNSECSTGDETQLLGSISRGAADT